jgi:hypothetical protein
LRNLELKEKETAVFEARVEPAKDPTMKIGGHKNSILIIPLITVVQTLFQDIAVAIRTAQCILYCTVQCT